MHMGSSFSKVLDAYGTSLEALQVPHSVSEAELLSPATLPPPPCVLDLDYWLLQLSSLPDCSHGSYLFFSAFQRSPGSLI